VAKKTLSSKKLIALTAILLLGPCHIHAASFEEQRAAAAAALESQSEEAILSLLTAGIAENRPAPAVALTSEWLRRNLPKNPAVLFQAARAAELSGETKNAVAYHQQALKLADPKSTEAGASITAVHTLLIYRLNDNAGAYVFAQTEAERLSVNPSFRQFDRWFLNEAVKRNDPTGMAKRLNASISAGVSADLLNVEYSKYFVWLLESVDSYCDRPGTAPLSQDLHDAIKDLCDVMTHNEEMKLSLDWAVSVKAYNLSRFGDQSKGKVGARGSSKKPGGNKPGNKPGKKTPEGGVTEEKKLEVGDGLAAPIAEATALLEKYPQYAMWVMTGWAGGGNGPHYRGDFKKYWPHEADAKMAPILAALTRLSPVEAIEVLSAAANGGYVGSPGILELKSVQDYLKANPALLKNRNGLALLEKEWNKYTPEEAQKVALTLAQSTHPHASLLRAIAAGGKDYDMVMATFHGSEAWRLSPTDLNATYTDLLWHYCGRPGGNAKRDEQINKSKALAATFAAADAKKEDPADKRIAAFRNLWADYKSPQPKIPGVRSRLAAVLKFTPEVITELLKDTHPDAQGMVRDAIAAGMEDEKGPMGIDARMNSVSLGVYNPWFYRMAQGTYGGLNRFKDDKERYTPHRLEPALRAAVSERLAQGKIEPWLAMAWISVQFPDNNVEQVKLMQDLFKTPAWAGQPFQVQYAAREWFGKDAMTPGQIAMLDAMDPALLFKNLNELPKEADAATATAALTAAVDGLRKSPVFHEIQGSEKLAAISEEVFADQKLQALIIDLIDKRLIIEPTANFGQRVFTVLTKINKPTEYLRASGYLWRNVAVNHRTHPAMLTLSESLLETEPSVSYAFANDGLGVIERHAGGHTWFKAETDLPRLKSIRSKAASKLGLISIPVPPTHPAYPIYQAQAEWMSGNEDSSWKLINANWEVFTTTHRELTISFLMWTLERTIFGRDDSRQEFLIKSLMAWAGEASSPLTATEKATIELSYGDIALQRGQVRQAHEIYSRTRENPAYAELPIRHQASLRRIRAERISKNYDAALQSLTDLEMERVPEIWTEVRFARSEVYFDREDFDDAKDDVDSILAREPNDPDARILLGKIQLKRQKLMEATEVELGSTSAQKNIVPGERLKVTLSDPTLAVSGAGTEIEVVVWAVSGDKETFFLRQFGDEKTKFRGEVPTALGAPAAADGILQVIGDDEVFYAYSEGFRKKMNNLDEKRGGPITIASDAMLMASARKLLTEAEQRSKDMELVMETIGNGANAETAAKAKIATGEIKIDHEKHISTIIKPGNLIHVRVSDPDRSRTPNVDEVNVSVSSSSGDSVSRVTLKETSTHSGVFEGRIPTTGAQASAFAQNSEPGRAPNMVISPNNDYPAWRPVATKGVTPDFTVDLNDNLPLGEFTITAKEPGAKLKQFIIQTGMSPTDMTTVAVYPRNLINIEKPWHPSVTIMNDADQFHNNNQRSVYSLSDLQAHLDRGWISQQFAAGVGENVAGPSEAMTASISAKVKWMRENRHTNSHVIYRFRGYFYEPSDVTRRFKLALGAFQVPANIHPSVANPPEFLMAVNGKPITSKDKMNQLDGEINLRAGVHRFEIWATGWDCTIGFGRTVKLFTNSVVANDWVECPDKFFDPAGFPADMIDLRNSPAQLKANSDGTTFTATFAKDARARLIRILMIGNEGTVPAINKLTLTKPDGGKILPVAQDFAELNKNDTLEMLTGDKISVRYTDDRFVTKTRERHERFLDVSFTDARTEFADMEPRFNGRSNKDEPYYEKLLRFAHDKPLSLAVHDADMDSTVTPDKVKVSVETSNGTKDYEAVETGDSTGVFKLVLKPVTTASKKADEIQVPNDGIITARYLDEENNRPGVPTERIATIRHASFVEPEIRLSHATVTPAQGPGKISALYHGFKRLEVNEKPSIAIENISAAWDIKQDMYSTKQAPDGGFNAVLGQKIFVEVVAPQMALGVTSKIEIFAQTDEGRRAAGAATNEFNKDAPGSLLLEAGLDLTRSLSSYGQGHTNLPIYQGVATPYLGDNPDYDRFATNVALILGTLPNHGALSDAERYELTKASRDSLDSGEIDYSVDGLIVRPGENVHIGFRYTAADGSQKWATASAKVSTHPVFDLLTEDNMSAMTAAYVGEELNLRVVDLGADLTEASDTVSVLVQAKSGAKHALVLNESGPHTGIFKASYSLVYVGATAPKPEDASQSAPYDVRINGFPVTYGDTIAARYTAANGLKSETRMVTISKGADGTIEPFSKKYSDPEVAMRTQFSLAEAYLEVAKRRRKIGEHELADLDYQTAKQLLSSAVDQFNDASTRAHAEYLLGSLTMEEAEASKDPEVKETRYRAALTRFINVTGTYSETLHASKAQYQIATIYERLKEPDIAAQEYVKLAYKYPDSEYLAVSMARLGTHFLKKASEYEAKAKPLLEKGPDDKDATFEGMALQKIAVAEYLKTAQIFGRLQERFPTDPLAGQAGLSAGQSFMRAGKNQEAVDALKRVTDDVSYDGPTIRAQAMYWSGMCYQKLRQPMAAYSHFKRLTYDFPESEWAAFARGQLSQDSMLNLEDKLEMERLESEK
jgi:outer membrane protein assembly factor BamD (BamD/ComL family)